MEGNKEVKSKKKGCLTLIGIVVLLIILLKACFGGSDHTKPKQVPEINYSKSSKVLTENLIGKSDKQFEDLYDGEITKNKVEEDRTSKEISYTIIKGKQGVDKEKYLLDYYYKYLDKDEIHYLIDETTNTVTTIINTNGILSVTITEYNPDIDLKKDNKNRLTKLGSGMMLGNYLIDSNTGDIAKLDVVQ